MTNSSQLLPCYFHVTFPLHSRYIPRYIPRYIRSFEKKKRYSPGVRSLKKMFDILSNTSAFKHRRKMKPPSFDSSCLEESNGSGYILLRPLDAKIFGKTSNGAV